MWEETLEILKILNIDPVSLTELQKTQIDQQVDNAYNNGYSSGANNAATYTYD